MRRYSPVYLACCAGVSLLGAACTGGSGDVAEVPIDTLGPPPSVVLDDTTSPSVPEPAPATTATPAPSTSMAAPTSTATPPTTEVLPPNTDGFVGPMFSDSLGVKVDTAPGVNTRGDTRRLLDEGVWIHIAWEPDPDDASVFTVQPDDIPILEAYAMAQRTYYRAALGLTTTTDPDFERYVTGGGARFVEAFSRRAAEDLVLNVGSGVVLRPYVLGDSRTDTSAIILDCYLEDEQELPKGTEPTRGGFRTYDLVVSMIRVDGQWKVDRTGKQAGVCL